MSTDPLLAEADLLYAQPPAGFTAARDARARELKPVEPDLAARVKALRKPSAAAWVVNLLVRRETGQVEQVLGMGASLREAQAALDGAELRTLTRQRRRLTAAVTARARVLAAEAGHRVTEPVAAQVEATLTAAMVDAGAAAAVRSGLLVSALASTGVEAADVGSALAVPGALGFSATARGPAEPERRGELRPVPDPGEEAAARRAAEEALAAAERQAAAADAAHEEARSRVERLQATGLQLQAELDELRRRVVDLESQAEGSDEDLAEAEVDLAQAVTEKRSAHRRRDAARAALGD